MKLGTAFLAGPAHKVPYVDAYGSDGCQSHQRGKDEQGDLFAAEYVPANGGESSLQHPEEAGIEKPDPESADLPVIS